MPTIRFFAQAREAAGRTTDELDAVSVEDLLAQAVTRYGDDFAAVLRTSQVWVNGEPATDATVLEGTDEVAVLPPISGGAVAR